MAMDNSGKTLRIMFQGGGDSAPAAEMKDFIKANTGLDIEIDVIPPESLHEKQLSVFTAGSSDYDLIEVYPTWIGEYAEAGYIDNLDPLYEKYAEEINVDDFIPGAQVGFDKYQGSWYAIPYDGDVNIFYYRQDLIDDPAEQEAFMAKYGYELAVLTPGNKSSTRPSSSTGRTRASPVLARWLCAPGGPPTTGPTSTARTSRVRFRTVW